MLWSIPVCLLVVLAVFWLSQTLPWRVVTKKRAVVVLVSGKTVSGVVTARQGPLLTLDDVSVAEQGQMIPIDGRMVVERSRIEWIQVT